MLVRPKLEYASPIWNPLPKLNTGPIKTIKNRGHYIATKCRINTAVISFYPRAIRISNKIPSHITETENAIGFQTTVMNLPFTTPNDLNCL